MTAGGGYISSLNNSNYHELNKIFNIRLLGISTAHVVWCVSLCLHLIYSSLSIIDLILFCTSW